jgi:hypothetical protein
VVSQHELLLPAEVPVPAPVLPILQSADFPPQHDPDPDPVHFFSPVVPDISHFFDLSPVQVLFDLSHVVLVVAPCLQQFFCVVTLSLVVTVLVVVVVEVCAFTLNDDPRKMIIIGIMADTKNNFFIVYIFWLVKFF